MPVQSIRVFGRALAALAVFSFLAILPLGCGSDSTTKEPVKEAPGIKDANNSMQDFAKKK
jgi:hypothetical protein